MAAGTYGTAVGGGPAAERYGNETLTATHRGMNWSAVWAGVFTFAAIWSVFGTLGLAVFASSANPNAAHPVSGLGVGESIWVIILTIIAMYVAGLVTGRLAAATTKEDGVAYGQAMFGLSVVGVLVLIAMAGAGLSSGATAGTASSHSPYVLGAVADAGWAGFLALFLGWIGAMIGSSHGQRLRTRTANAEKSVQEIRRHAA
jgi:hypothetical protein